MSDRKAEIDEMDRFELLDLLEQIRDIIWNTEDAADAVLDIRKLIGEPEDWEGDDDDSYYEEPEDKLGDEDKDEEPKDLNFDDD